MTDSALKYMTGSVNSVTCKWLILTSHYITGGGGLVAVAPFSDAL